VEQEPEPKLTVEEEIEVQRDIALNTVFFFLAFIGACFGLLYVYHRM
jgi:hypothetical protein